MDSILDILKLLLSHDPFVEITLFLLITVFVSLVIIIFGLRVFLKFLDKEETLTKQLSENIERHGTTQIEIKNNNTKKTTKLVKVYVKLNNLLKAELKNACLTTDAERIAIYLFHNGTYSLNGFPFIKISCICEILGNHSNTTLKQHLQTNIPINAVDDFLTELFHHHIFISSKSEKDLKVIKKLLLDRQEDTNEYIAIAITDKSEIDEPPIGFLLAEFDNKDFNKKCSQDKLDILVNAAEDAAYTLQVSHVVKETKGKENIDFYG